MDSRIGRLTYGQLKEKIENKTLDTVIIAYIDQYGQLLGKRLDGAFFLESRETSGCNYVLTADINMQPLSGFTMAGWERGFGDFRLKPDLETIRELPWCSSSALILADLLDENGIPVPQSPRAILQKQYSKLSERGIRAFAASELEFYLFDTPLSSLYQAGPSALIPISNYPVDYHILAGNYQEHILGDIRRMTAAAGIPVESSKGETGLGQYEIALKYAEVQEMADRHVIYKHGVKSIVHRHGASATFMAKYSHEDSGSSCHIHMSLWDIKTGKNMFAREHDVFEHFLAGILELTEEMFLFYAPTVNSYKRFSPGSFAPVNVSWDYDNRTVGYRVVGEASSFRIENRFPGADANPCTAYAAMLAAGMYGIEQELTMPERTLGSAYENESCRRIPETLDEAAAKLDSSQRVRKILGDEVVDHYVRHARKEVAAFRKKVSAWEVMRYFERI
ncbi:MAG: glutamine synthetase family protein [Spirochaetales bacterium]|nr:glutamine synthetase family protein [Spirochaetales bacterium]